VNTVSPSRRWTPAEAQSLEARFGLRVAAQLHTAAADVPHDVSERLRVARLQAVDRARLARQPAAAPVRQTAPSIQLVHADPYSGTLQGTVAMLDGDDQRDETWWRRLGILLLVLLMGSGLMGIDWWRTQEQIQTAAEIDAALLGDALPPTAYTDPGFTEYLAAHPLVVAPAAAAPTPSGESTPAQ
jgi:hypothetical protein